MTQVKLFTQVTIVFNVGGDESAVIIAKELDKINQDFVVSESWSEFNLPEEEKNESS